MKKLSLLFISLMLAVQGLYASHIVGGEINWRCIKGTGQYVFYTTLYRDCGPNTAGYPTNPITLSVLNTPRPNNNSLSTITLNYVTPTPGTPIGPNGGAGVGTTCQGCSGSSPLQCGPPNGDYGSLEKYEFRSNPITLAGKPPSGNANQWLNGWVFVFTPPCCRSNSIQNLVNKSGAILKAIMYGDGRASQDPCYDNSPEFREAPATLICEGYDFQFNHNASDNELDSLVFGWENVMDGAGFGANFAPQFNSWAAGFALNAPTPTPAMNPKNKTATINPATGEIRMTPYLPATVPVNRAGIYVTSSRVDAYALDANNNRVKTASIFRDMPFNIFRCPNINFTYVDNNGVPTPINTKNTPPYIQIDNKAGSLSLDTTIYAGDYLSVSFVALDSNYSPCSVTNLTNVSIEPSGYQFDKNFNDSLGNCPIKPCAILSPAPTGAPIKRLKGIAQVGTRFKWQTTCDHLNPVGTQQIQQGKFLFVMKVYDDFCPVPAINYPTISVTLKAPEPLGPPLVRCVNVNPDGSFTISWTGPEFPDTTNSFDSYDIYLYQRVRGSNTAFVGSPTPFVTGLTDYEGSHTFASLFYDPNTEYAFKMVTRWGCFGLQESLPSPIFTTFNRLNASNTGTGPVSDPRFPFTEVTLNWKSIVDIGTAVGATNNGKLHYDATTKHLDSWDGQYLIYRRYNPHNAGPWILIDSTATNTFVTRSPVCDDSVSFKIVSRDTSSCISTSNSVTMRMVTLDPPPAPPLLEASTQANGDVYLEWNTNIATTAGSYLVYETNALGVLNIPYLDSVVAPANSYMHVGAQGDLGQKYYKIVPIDSCGLGSGDTSKLISPVFHVLDSVINDTINCKLEIRVNWSAFKGYGIGNLNRVNGYDIYGILGGGAPFLIGSTTNLTSFTFNAEDDTTYQIYIVAKNNQNLASTSNIITVVTPPTKPAYYVAPPEIRCVQFVGGVIDIITIPSANPETNFIRHELQRFNSSSSNWVTIGTETDITVTQFTDPSPVPPYRYRIATFSDYCGRVKDTIDGKEVTPILVTATATPQNGPSIRIDWTNTGITGYTNNYELFKGLGLNPTLSFLKNIPLGTNTNTDFGVCGDTGTFQIQIQDTSGCFSISNTGTNTYQDPFPPAKQFVDYVTVDYTDINNLQTTVVWSPNAEPDVEFYEAFQVINPTTFNTSGNLSTFTYTFPGLNLADGVDSVFVIATDSCGAPSPDPYDFHSTMDVDVEFSVCDSSNYITWNPYKFFRSGAQVQYEIYMSQTKVFANFTLVGATNKPSFTHTGVTAAGTYYYYVKAIDNQGAGPFASLSNIGEVLVEAADAPKYQYMHSVFVQSPTSLELLCYVDTTTITAAYEVRRGALPIPSMLNKVAEVDAAEVINGVLSYKDYNVNTEERSYYYTINALDSCGNLSLASNLGKSILLTVQADNVSLSNTLQWQPYEEWANGVDRYLIYRGVDNQFNLDPYDTVYVTPTDGPIYKYVDEVRDYQGKKGQYCYYVVAIENGVGVPSIAAMPSGSAISNAVCTYLEPIMYIPNAFTPGSSINPVFRPQGIYFDFTRYEMVIYNRWGETLFETNDYLDGWDGKYQGEYVPVGSYVYTIRFMDSKNEERIKKGTITVIR